MSQQKLGLNPALPTRSIGVWSQGVDPLSGRKTSLTAGTRASNSTLATAKKLGTFPPGHRNFKDSVGSKKSSDFFQIEITENSRIKLFLTNRSEGEISGAILNAAGKVVTANGKRQQIAVSGGEKASTLVPTAQPGIYYLQVKNATNSKNAYEVNLFVNRKGGPTPLPCGCGV